MSEDRRFDFANAPSTKAKRCELLLSGSNVALIVTYDSAFVAAEMWQVIQDSLRANGYIVFRGTPKEK